MLPTSELGSSVFKYTKSITRARAFIFINNKFIRTKLCIRSSSIFRKTFGILLYLFNIHCDIKKEFLFNISAAKVTKTNLSCILKTNIVCDRSEPTVTCDLANGEKVLFKCENLDTLDIVTLYNKHITSLAPPEVETETKKSYKRKKSSKRKKIRISRHRR
ncbi:mitochondrial ribosomal protein L53 isoform X1 [Cotesia typhae]|uniref:mitochondrial ribosomal protein L53 isoform X1 n=1 Tax=Cotesia typhae TaxID=2053667 RepID=UPI003D697DEA